MPVTCKLEHLHKKVREGDPSVVVRFCHDCGGSLNSNVKPDPDCHRQHASQRERGHKYCSDCGIKL